MSKPYIHTKHQILASSGRALALVETGEIEETIEISDPDGCVCVCLDAEQAALLIQALVNLGVKLPPEVL